MEQAFFYAGISLPLQRDKGELCESINEDKTSSLPHRFIDLADQFKSIYRNKASQQRRKVPKHLLWRAKQLNRTKILPPIYYFLQVERTHNSYLSLIIFFFVSASNVQTGL